MSKHTPGPWFAASEGSYKVASVTSNTGIYADTLPEAAQIAADARLIAAAPDLLSVCKELVASAAYWSDYDVPVGIVDRLRAAIAKAEGSA